MQAMGVHGVSGGRQVATESGRVRGLEGLEQLSWGLTISRRLEMRESDGIEVALRWANLLDLVATSAVIHF
jgi:hypothetical protein